MVRSRPRPNAATLLGIALAITVVASLVAGARRHERAGSAAHSASARPATAARRRPGRPTDDQVIERVRRITPWVTQGHTRRKLVALTFDDGPGPLTPAFLRELRKLHAPATFFQVAQSVNAHPGTARREHAAPFAVGTHTATHAHLPQIGAGGQRREVAGGARVVDENARSYPRMFRPPYGEWNSETLAELRRHRMLMVLWTLTTRDWAGLSTGAIVASVIHGVRPGAIVLMHDFGGLTREPTLHALPRIVHALRRKGYRFVTVPEMLRLAPPRRRPPRPPAPYPA